MLDQNFLNEEEMGWALPPDLYSSHNVRGTYTPMQFAVRVQPDILHEIELLRSGTESSDFREIQAYSIYFHETIHWWQHVGSTSGLMLSLIYPAQSHINNQFLKELIKKIGPVKSILKYDSVYARSQNKTVNAILNNWHDIEFFGRFSIDPKKALHESSPFFESIGHSYYIAYTAVIETLSITFDNDFNILPDIREWHKGFDSLKQKKVQGFYYGSDKVVPSIGAKAIFEGQACFSQLQYLYLSSGGRLGWKEFEGMLFGVYIEAFEVFLKILGESWPATPAHPLVGLFLVLCDISINPIDGFPFNIDHFESFIKSVDPGMRFFMLCHAVQRKQPSLKGLIRKYVREEYLAACEILCKEIACKTPRDGAEKVSAWSSSHPGCLQLLEEDRLFDFLPLNLPVRVFFARFMLFQIDKYKTPEFFCWPGVWAVGERKGGITSEQLDELLENHRALFLNRADGEIVPRTFADKNDEAISKTFNTFYGWNMIYDLTRQWIVREGAFDFNYSWLTNKLSTSEITEWVRKHFEEVYGVNPMSFKIICNSTK